MGWLGLEQMVRMVTGLVVGIYVARHLGPAGYGVIGYATALMLIGSALSRMGLQEVVTRDLVRDEPRRNLTLGSAFALRLTGGVLAYGVLLLFGLYAAADVQTRLAVLVIGAGVLAQPFDMAGAWFQAHQRLAPLVLARLTGVLGCAALRIGFVLTGQAAAVVRLAGGGRDRHRRGAWSWACMRAWAAAPLHWRVSRARLRRCWRRRCR